MQIFLTTPGSSLRVRDGLFEVSYFDDDRRPRKAEHAPALIQDIWLNEGTTVTIAAIRLAMINNIDLVICDRRGDPEGRLMSLRPSTTALVQKAQALVSVTPQALCYARDWVVRKLESMAALLDRLAKRRKMRDAPVVRDAVLLIVRMRDQMRALSIAEPHSAEPSGLAATLRGLEGAASKAFFAALSAMLPPQYQFTERSRRPAKDPFNAYLNYAYAMLYRKVERALVRAGLNSYIGFMHRDGYQFKSLVFDFIEPFRADMIQSFFGLFSKQSLRPDAHYTQAKDGSVLLTKAGKTLLITKINKFYEKREEWEGMNMTRARILEKEAVQLAHALTDVIGLPASADTDETEMPLEGVSSER